MRNIYKALSGAALIITVALIFQKMGVGPDITFGVVTIISGFTAAAIVSKTKHSSEGASHG